MYSVDTESTGTLKKILGVLLFSLKQLVPRSYNFFETESHIAQIDLELAM